MQKLKINIRKGSKKIFVLLIFILLFISIFFILSSNNTNLLAISIDEDSDNDGWNDTIERSYNTDINNSSDFPKDTDSDGIPDLDSLDGNYTGDLDDDGDEINDFTENTINTNPLNPYDILKITYKNNIYYLIDNNEDLVYDELFTPIGKGKLTNIEHLSNDKYNIDIDGDLEWDIVYSNGETTGYIKAVEKFEIPWIFLIPTIIFIILLVIFLLFKCNILYLYDEYVEE